MGLTKHFQDYFGAITLGIILVGAYFLIQLPFNLWLPGYTLLPEWLQDRTGILLIGTYYIYFIIPAFLVGTAIFYYRVLSKI